MKRQFKIIVYSNGHAQCWVRDRFMFVPINDWSTVGLPFHSISAMVDKIRFYKVSKIEYLS